MKKLYLTMLILFISISFSNIFAQTELVVEPGYGTLNAAIEANLGAVIYKLKAGEWYGIDKPIQNDGFALTIIGEMPSDEATSYAIIQTGTNTDGTVFPFIFDLLGDLTLKNLFLNNQNQDGAIPPGCIKVGIAGLRVELDNNVIDPMTRGNCLTQIRTDENTSFIITNNLFITNGFRDRWGAHFMQVHTGTYMDTLWIENNTFLSAGVGFIRNEFVRDRHVNVAWINHNSFINGSGQYADQLPSKDEYYFTNNLFWGCGWFDNKSQLSEQDLDYNPSRGITSLAKMDTIVVDTLGNLESLPSTQKAFVEYNAETVHPTFKEWVQVDTGYSWIMPIIWDENVPNNYTYPTDQPVTAAQLAESREYAMLKDKANFPNYKYGNTMYEKDPGWTDSRIYSVADSVVDMFEAVHVFLKRGGTHQALWTWDIDTWNGVPIADQPVTWPRFDGTYSNPELLSGSIEGLPLGDLNWFPEMKAAWEANRASIEDHIKSLNDSKIVVGVEAISSSIPDQYSLSQNYPNPFNPTTNIQFSLPESGMVSLKVFNVLGQEVANLVNQELKAGVHKVDFDASKLTSGVYFYTLESGNFVQTNKMTLLK